MKRIFQKIEWKTRRWSFEVNLFNIYFPANSRTWGFEVFKITLHNKDYSLLKLLWILPNGTDQIQVQFFWDLFFLNDYLENRAIDRYEAKLWSRKSK